MSFFIVNIFDQGLWNNYEPMSLQGVLIMLGVIGFFLISYKIMNKRPSKKSIDIELNLEPYTLGFDNYEIASKKVSLLSKIGVFIISLFLVLIPLEDLIYANTIYDSVSWYWILW